MSDKMQGGVKAGSTSVSLTFLLRSTADSTETTGKVAADMTVSYLRQGGTRTAITASDLAAVNSAFSSGGVKEIDAANMPGIYRLDVPDAAFASGADWVEICVKVSACFAYHERIPLTTNVIQTGDAFARIGAPAGASVSADVAAVKGVLPAALVGGRMDSSIGAVANGVIAAASFAANALDAVWSTTTRLLTAGTNIVLAKGTGVTGFTDLDASGVRGAVGLAAANLDTQLSAINSKTTNLPSDPADQSLIIAATDAIMTRLGAPAGASVSADIGAVKSDSGAIKTKTDNLPTDPADESLIIAATDALAALLTAVKAKTDGLPVSPAAVGDAMTLTSAYDFAKGTIAMTEAYAANGAAPTPVQALYAIQQMLTMFSIAGTNLTVKKLDGSTTAFVVTLNDATTPTAATRS